jgi:hypothetical protein
MLIQTSEAFDAWTKNWSSPAPTTYQGSDELAFQRWFKFKEAFSPALVRSVVDGQKKRPEHILDCCGGSGTTGVVAQFMGIESTLIEVNPFLADLIESKLANYQHVDLPSEAARVIRRAHQYKVDLAALRKRLPPTFIEPGVNERWLFSKNVAKTIESYRLAISECSDETIKRLFTTALASILIPASNVRIDGKGRRYRSNWEARNITSENVREAFLGAVGNMIEDIYRHARVERAKYNLLRGDAREQIQHIKSEVSLAIFSPPYPNSFDYTDIYNVELWMLGYFSVAADNTALRHSTLRSHVQCTWDSLGDALPSKTLTRTLEKLDDVRNTLWNRRLPEMVRSYFGDMQTLLRESSLKLSREGQIAMVVGNSSYANVLIDVPAILCELAHDMGLRTVSSKSARAMRSSIQQGSADKTLAESLVILARY